MTRKDYAAIARLMKLARKLAICGENSHACIGYIEDGIAAILSADNPRFNRERFYAACKLGE